MKVFVLSFLANVLAMAAVSLAIGAVAVGYVDSKIEPIQNTIDNVTTLVETGNERLEQITATAENTIDRVDAKITETDLYTRFFKKD